MASHNLLRFTTTMATVILIAAFVTLSGASDASVDIVNHMGPGNPIQVSEQGEI
jgi:hypothetical protein